MLNRIAYITSLSVFSRLDDSLIFGQYRKPHLYSDADTFSCSAKFHATGILTSTFLFYLFDLHNIFMRSHLNAVGFLQTHWRSFPLLLIRCHQFLTGLQFNCLYCLPLLLQAEFLNYLKQDSPALHLCSLWFFRSSVSSSLIA